MRPEQVQQFETDGYLNGITINSTDEANRAREAFDRLEADEGREHCEIGLQGRHLDVPFIRALAHHPLILDHIEALMGPDIMVLSTHAFCKYPQTHQKFVAWHQDVTYWGLEPAYALTAWYAIDDSDEQNGCMRVLPGSHQQGVVEHGTSDQPGNLLSINQQVSCDIDEQQAVNLELRSGQISIHHGQLIHNSHPNHSDRRRCGLTIRYCPPHVKPVKLNSLGQSWPAVLARGEDRYRHFEQQSL